MSIFIRCLALAGVIMLTACTSAQQKTAQDAASSAPQQLADAAIATEVKAKLAAIDVDSATAVHVQVTGGAVTLSGEVRSSGQRSDFEAAARSAGGVKSVVDQTRANPALRGARESLDDAAIVAKVMGALGAQAGINALSIHASVKDGMLTLSGTVPTQAIQTTVLQTAHSVHGVRSVTDHLRIRP